MAVQKIPLYIPSFINSATYAPARVLPRIYFYNGQVDCEYWWVTNESNAANRQDKFPYFDHYNVVTGSFPTGDSRSLLFNNEAASYGIAPSGSLYSTYWEKYISFLYDPRTRILNCQAIIPLADYFKMSLNDVVNFRGNYWHLRAINDYSLKTGECNLQLVGPIISDTFNQLTPQPEPTPVPEESSSINWFSIATSGAPSSFRIYENGSNKVTSTSTNGGTFFATASHTIAAELDITSFPSSGSVTMSLFVTGATTFATSSSSNVTLSTSFTAVAGQTYSITGSVVYNAPPNPITFTVGSGTYPLSGTGTTCSGTIKNNSGSTIYVYGKFNSGGNTSGNVSSDGGNVDTTALSFIGTVSGSGQDIISTNYHTLSSDNTTYNWDLSKNDSMTSGATIRLAYSSTPGGTLTNLTQ